MFSDVFRGCFRNRLVNSAMEVACMEKNLHRFQYRLYGETTILTQLSFSESARLPAG